MEYCSAIKICMQQIIAMITKIRIYNIYLTAKFGLQLIYDCSSPLKYYIPETYYVPALAAAASTVVVFRVYYYSCLRVTTNCPGGRVWNESAERAGDGDTVVEQDVNGVISRVKNKRQSCVNRCVFVCVYARVQSERHREIRNRGPHPDVVGPRATWRTGGDTRGIYNNKNWSGDRFRCLIGFALSMRDETRPGGS